MMKKQILYFIVLFCFSNTISSQNRFSFGLGGTTIYDPFEIGIQAKIKFDILEKTGTAATFSYLFDENINWVFDLDQHYNDFIKIGDLGLSPFGGLNLLSTELETFWGLNLGLFTDFELHHGRVLYVEPKFTLGKSDRFALSMGIQF